MGDDLREKVRTKSKIEGLSVYDGLSRDLCSECV